MEVKKKSILDFNQMVEDGEKIVFLTAYDYLSAKYQERGGVEIILVGDSLGMVQLGFDTTFPVTMDQMISHAASVRRGAPNTFIVGDMPYMSYQTSNADAIQNAGRFIKEAGCDCIKLEGAGDIICERITNIVGAGVMVMGHIGLTPQFSAQLGGYKAQGKSADAAIKLLNEAKKLEEAGCWSILIEGVPAIVGKIITDNLNIPIFGIGAGPHTDGQLLIYADMVGYYDDFKPKFVKRYGNVGELLLNCFQQYVSEVKNGTFPDEIEYSYTIKQAKIDKLNRIFE